MGKCMITLISIVLILSGCQEAVLQDPYTKEEINIVKPSEGTFLIRAQNDSMLGVSDYLSNDLVVDPDAYKEKAIQRGDVIYLVNPPFQSSTNPKLVLADKGILRVIGLSGEKIRMEKGQIYINNKRLDTFYGKDYNNDADRIKKRLKDPNLADYEIENYQNALRFVENENMEEITIPDGMIFVMGDNRSRAADSVLFGPLPSENVLGKIIGMVETPSG